MSALASPTVSEAHDREPPRRKRPAKAAQTAITVPRIVEATKPRKARVTPVALPAPSSEDPRRRLRMRGADFWR
jgi:hypothetical protein